jgi:hypothetical protein
MKFHHIIYNIKSFFLLTVFISLLLIKDNLLSKKIKERKINLIYTKNWLSEFGSFLLNKFNNYFFKQYLKRFNTFEKIGGK